MIGFDNVLKWLRGHAFETRYEALLSSIHQEHPVLVSKKQNKNKNKNKQRGRRKRKLIDKIDLKRGNSIASRVC